MTALREQQITGFDIDAVRADFPILARKVYDKPLVYLDNAASAQKPRQVVDAMTAALTETYSNVHRGLHFLSNQSTDLYEEARKKVAGFLNASRPEEIIFTSGGTEAFNLLSYALGVDRIGEGDEIVLSVAEHHSNIVPWHLLRERKGAVLKWLDVDDTGAVDPEAFEKLLTPRTKLVAMSHMSNVLGRLTAAKEIVARARDAGVLTLLDGCQATVHAPVDVQDLGCDFYVFTGHKLYGPNGAGVLYGRYDLLAELPPYKGGGEMIDIVEQDRITYAPPPQRFEAGTPAIVEAIGLGAAIDYLNGIDRAAALAHEHALGAYARSELRKLNWVTLYGDPEGDSAIVPFSMEGAHPHDIGALLDRSGVAVRAGHHCAQPLMARLNVPATAAAFSAASARLSASSTMTSTCSSVSVSMSSAPSLIAIRSSGSMTDKSS